MLYMYIGIQRNWRTQSLKMLKREVVLILHIRNNFGLSYACTYICTYVYDYCALLWVHWTTFSSNYFYKYIHKYMLLKNNMFMFQYVWFIYNCKMHFWVIFIDFFQNERYCSLFSTQSAQQYKYIYMYVCTIGAFKYLYTYILLDILNYWTGFLDTFRIAELIWGEFTKKIESIIWVKLLCSIFISLKVTQKVVSYSFGCSFGWPSPIRMVALSFCDLRLFI